MKQKLALLLTVILPHLSLHAQTAEEWFRQKATQKKYLIAQLAGLKTYSQFLKQGYQAATKGLTTIYNIKEGHSLLDKNFFNSLQLVNPTINMSGIETRIKEVYQRIIDGEKALAKSIRKTTQLLPNEKSYAVKVYTSTTECASNQLQWLLATEAEQTLQLSDDERLLQLENILRALVEIYSFQQSFGNACKQLILQREHENGEIQTTIDLTAK